MTGFTIKLDILSIVALLFLLLACQCGFSYPLSTVPDRQSIAMATEKEIWIDPIKGNDRNDGSQRTRPCRTLSAAWNRIPPGKSLTATGYRIMLVAGHYRGDVLIPEGWMEKRCGTSAAPVTIKSADGNGKAVLHGYFNIFQCNYLNLVGLQFVTDPGYGGGGNVVHVEGSNHITLRSCILNGFDGKTRQPQETLKINQCQYVEVESCDISGASWFALDFVAVQYGHITGCRIHGSGDDCVVLKGGSACLNVDGNRIFDCGNIGFAAGQGTGFEFMTPPWIHYEAYDIKLTNNLIYNARNAGIAVRGGYNILVAYNTLYKIGIDSERGSALLLLSPGARSCDGNEAGCRKNHSLGGWGPLQGDAGECIPNRNVFIYNNIFHNPAPLRTAWSHFTVFGPVSPPQNTNIPSPVLSDQNLRIVGNVFWNGPADLPLGIGQNDQGGSSSNPTCNETLVRRENLINSYLPKFADPSKGDYHIVPDEKTSALKAQKIPNFPGGDLPAGSQAPAGSLDNTVKNDPGGKPRSPGGLPGACSGS